MRRFLLLCTALLTVAACADQATTPSAGAEAFDIRSANVIIGGNMRMLRDGILTAHMIADSAYVYEDGRPWDLVTVKATFYTEQGVEAGTLTSETGEYDMTEGVFVAHGDVVLTTVSPGSGRRLETEVLHFNVQQDELWTDSPFTVQEEGRITTGTSFRSDSKFRTWHVTGATTQGAVSGDGGIRF